MHLKLKILTDKICHLLKYKALCSLGCRSRCQIKNRRFFVFFKNHNKSGWNLVEWLSSKWKWSFEVIFTHFFPKSADFSQNRISAVLKKIVSKVTEIWHTGSILGEKKIPPKKFCFFFKISWFWLILKKGHFCSIWPKTLPENGLKT